MRRWAPLAIPAAARFVMVLDQRVMNVSGQLPADRPTAARRPPTLPEVRR